MLHPLLLNMNCCFHQDRSHMSQRACMELFVPYDRFACSNLSLSLYIYIYTHICVCIYHGVGSQVAELRRRPRRRARIRSISEISSCFFGPRPLHIEIRHRVKQKHPQLICSDLRLKLKIRRLKLWKPTVVSIFYPFSQFCEIDISLPSLRKQPNTAPNLFPRGV